MKAVRASRKIEKAIDALVDLQQDYMDELEAAEGAYDVAIALSTLNRLATALEAL